MYRSPDLLSLAAKAPHCMGCDAPNRGQVVAAHSNQLRDGKGKGIKAHDFRVAFLCDTCHAEIDQGAHLSREERGQVWEAAHRRTIGWLFTAGHLSITLEPVVPSTAALEPRPKRPVGKSRRLASRGFAKGPKRKIPSRPFGS